MMLVLGLDLLGFLKYIFLQVKLKKSFEMVHILPLNGSVHSLLFVAHLILLLGL